MRSTCQIQRRATSSKNRNNKCFFKNGPVQAKLNINEPGDVYEQEADAVASKVMQTPAAETGSAFFQPKPIQTTSIQKKESAAVHTPAVSPSVDQTLNTIGQPMDKPTRSFMEQRFGYDFGNVKIHNDPLAHQSSSEINARAYTNANHIVFGSGQYQPETYAGKRLLAHELTHVMQQKQQKNNTISRAVANSSRCSHATDPSTLPNPITFLILDDMHANASLSQAISTLKSDISGSTGGTLAGIGFDAYRRRFGEPVESKKIYKNRFTNTGHTSLVAAQLSEMNTIVQRLELIQATLQKGISYYCLGVRARRAGGCNFRRCSANTNLATCWQHRTIRICPNYWTTQNDAKAIGIIHEVVHIIHGYKDHDTGPAYVKSASERIKEPECYASLVADINNEKSDDPSCPDAP